MWIDDDASDELYGSALQSAASTRRVLGQVVQNVQAVLGRLRQFGVCQDGLNVEVSFVDDKELLVNGYQSARKVGLCIRSLFSSFESVRSACTR